VTRLWANARVSYPVDVEPYTPAHHFEKGKQDPQFRYLRSRSPWSWCAGRCKPIFRCGRWWRTRSLARIAGSSRGSELMASGLCAGPQTLACVVASDQSARLVPGGRAGGPLAECRATWPLGEGHAHVPRWLFARVVGAGSHHRSLWTQQAGARRDRDHRSDHLARAFPRSIWSPICQRPVRLGLPTANWPWPVCRKWCDSLGYGCGSNRALNRSSTRFRWSQYQVRSDRAMRRHWQLVCCAFSHLAAIMPVMPRRSRCKRPESHLSRKCLPSKAFLPQRQERGKKSSEEKEMRPQLSWPRARRSVRGWLEPWIMLRRYWHGWSQQPLPASRCNSCFVGLNADTPSHSAVQLDPSSTNYRLDMG
jgi:hypothetical protein